MRLYLAGRFSRGRELKGYANELAAIGHDVTARWLTRHRDLHYRDLIGCSAVIEQADTHAREDLEDVAYAEVFIQFTDAGPAHGRGGKHVELGYALALNIPCWIVGPRENLFHHLAKLRHFNTWGEAVQVLRGVW